MCKDVRSDVESSSEEEEKEDKEEEERRRGVGGGEGPHVPLEIHGTFSRAAKGENGTNGHCAATVAAARAWPHNYHGGC